MNISIVILTGLSGAGKTVALRALEDSGYFCTDNMPPKLIGDFIALSSSSGLSSIAVGIDIREKGFLPEITGIMSGLKKKHSVDVVYLKAEKDVLIRRFKETRRPHPLVSQRGFDLEKAIAEEEALLTVLEDMADRIIDTSSLSPHQLRDHMRSLYGKEKKDRMNVLLTSFGFKYGVPSFADIIFDVRFLPNPHFVPHLKDLTGIDPQVKEYVKKDGSADIFLKKVKDMLDFLVPLYKKEGKSSLNICIGCTGGRHRSIVITEELKDHFEHYHVDFDVAHREL